MGLDPAVDEVVVLGAERLRDDVVDVEAQPAGIGAEGDDGLADREALEVGHAGLDHEPPPLPRWAAAFSKQATWASWVTRLKMVLKTSWPWSAGIRTSG